MAKREEKFGMEGPIAPIAEMRGEARGAPARELSYGDALRDALATAMEISPDVFVVGEGITDSGAVFGTTAGLLEKFGPRRVIESPLSENGITGVCVGAAIAGLRPVMVHQRIDFTLLAADQIVNHAAKWRYMYDGKLGVPLVLRCIVGKGWGQAAQHSQSLQALFAHIPGLRVAMPVSPYDAKGMLLASIFGGDPVLFIESRALYAQKAIVPAGDYRVPLGEAAVLKPGRDITLFGVSYQVPALLEAAKLLAPEIDAEVVDLRSVSPLDRARIVESAKRTGAAAIADTSWKSFGISAEVAALVQEECFGELRAPVLRIALPDVPTPCSADLEKVFYPDVDAIVERVRAWARLMRAKPARKNPRASARGNREAPKSPNTP